MKKKHSKKVYIFIAWSVSIHYFSINATIINYNILDTTIKKKYK